MALVATLAGVTALLALLPALADRLILRHGGSPLTAVALALVTLFGMVAVPLTLVLCSGEAALQGRSPAVGEVVAPLLLVALGISAGRALARAVAARARLRRLELAAISVAARRGERLYLLGVGQPLAFSTATRAFVSEGLLEQLPPDQSDAVVAHELSHARGRHWRVVAGASALCAGLLGVPPARKALALLQRELDVVADRAAVRELGNPTPVAGALRALGQTEGREAGDRLVRLNGGRAGEPILRAAVAVVGGALLALLCLAVHGGFAAVAAIACTALVAAFGWFMGPMWRERG